jgi:hypothetical protein
VVTSPVRATATSQSPAGSTAGGSLQHRHGHKPGGSFTNSPPRCLVKTTVLMLRGFAAIVGIDTCPVVPAALLR